MIRLENVLKTSLQSVLRCLEDVLKMSWRCFCKTSWRYLKDVFTKRLENVLETSWKCMTKTEIVVLPNTSSSRLQDVFWRRLYQDKCLLEYVCSNSNKICSNLLNFITFKELLEKSALLKIGAQAFEAGDFLNICLRVFEARFRVKVLITCIQQINI